MVVGGGGGEPICFHTNRFKRYYMLVIIEVKNISTMDGGNRCELPGWQVSHRFLS